MSDGPDPERLKALEDKLAKLRGKKPVGPRAGGHATHAHAGWRMVTELVTGIVMGFGIGWGLDGLFGTLPILMVLFTMLGFAAGVRVMLGTAREIQGYSQDAEAPGTDDTAPDRTGQEKGNAGGDGS